MPDSAALANLDKPEHIFAWKLALAKDPFGNRIEYIYERDRTDQADERHGHHSDQPLLKEIRYADYSSGPGQFRFPITVNFEYEDRDDRFSDYRAGFEIRTTQRCKSISVETHFDRTRPVRTYKFGYDYASSNKVSLLQKVEVIGYEDQGNPYDGSTPQHEKQLPPLTFSYSIFDPIHAEHRDLIPITGQDQPPAALGNPNYELVDLTGDGLPDVLEMNGTVRYWRNLGEGCFDLPRKMRVALPYALADIGVQMLDANGDGRADMLVTNGSVAGYYPLNFDGTWDRSSFRLYREAPSFNLGDPEVKLVDLDGDGITDVVRSGTRLECFFNDPDPRKAWTRTRWVERQALEVFPKVNFSDPRVKWGDMTGDGLQDIVLVYDGNVEYWPNLGHGNWDKRIHMADSSHFAEYGYTFGYDPRRLLIGDVDGDGCADIVYVDDDKVVVWINRSGNSCSKPIVIPGTPPVTDMDSVRLVDFLGTGIAGVLWSADVNAHGYGRPHMFFLDFTGGVKPYLLDETDNHLGAVTKVKYVPSTWFYLQDQKQYDTQWKTSLPFPVQVVAQVEVIDQISQGRLTTEYKYHHGYWDGAEREFRGFGMVEQLDTETFDVYNDLGLHGLQPFQQVGLVDRLQFSPPTLTKTWFHQGPIGPEFGEWREIDWTSEWWNGDGTLLGHKKTMDEFLDTRPGPRPLDRRYKRDALRSLRGSILRTELYALDGVDGDPGSLDRQVRPYTVTESAYAVTEIDAPADPDSDRTRIFFPHVVAQRTTQWERSSEPLTQFSFNGDYDSYGQPRSQISIAVPRGRDPMQSIAASAPAPQPYLATHTVIDYAQRDDGTILIVDRIARATTFEIANNGCASVLDLKRTIESRALDSGQAIISQIVNYYDGASFTGLPYQQIGRCGALVRTEQLVLTEDILQQAYQNERPPHLNLASVNWTSDYPADYRTNLAHLAGYLYYDGLSKPEHSRGYFAVTAQREFDFQRSASGTGRGLVLAQRDPLDHTAQLEYEYQLLLNKVTDAANLTTTAHYNYRVMQPRLVTDPNGNMTEFSFTPIGLVSQIFVRDKNGTGDISNPSTRFEYDFLAFERGPQGSNPNPPPVKARTIRRIHHDGEANVIVSVRDESIETREYSDGFGRLIQTRTQAEDVVFGDALFGRGVLPIDQSDPATTQSITGTLNAYHQSPNVVVSGWQVYDNKGRVVEKYEPFFDTGWDFAPPTNAQLGEKALMYYDPRGQVIRTVNPDQSEQRVIYGKPRLLDTPDVYDPTPWEAYTYDVNDNAGRTHAGDPRAILRQHHWNTPANIIIDALGRTIETVERNRHRLANGSWSAIEEYHTTSTYDIRGNVLTVTDALGRVAFRHEYDLANRALRIVSIDAGTRAAVFDAAGNLIEHRDSKGALELNRCDVLNRMTRLWARDHTSQAVTLRQRLIFGDDLNRTGLTPSQTLDRNLLGRLYRHFDEAGLLQLDRYDFKGNLVDKSRRVIRDAAMANNWRADWDAPGSANVLDPASQAYQTNTRLDALNRAAQIIYPRDVNNHRATLKPIYNRAGALEQVELDGATYVERIAYNAKGQRVLITYGNGVMTRHAYDPQTFRLTRLRTEVYAHPAALTYQPNGGVLQDFAYQYDLAGNILQITDVSPGCGVRNNSDAARFPMLSTKLAAGDALVREFLYDPIYRLVQATGRQAAQLSIPCTDYDPRRGGFNWSGQTGMTAPSNARDVTQTLYGTLRLRPRR